MLPSPRTPSPFNVISSTSRTTAGLSPSIEIALQRQRELRTDAERTARVRRLVAARRWRRRAALANQRARQAAAAVR